MNGLTPDLLKMTEDEFYSFYQTCSGGLSDRYASHCTFGIHVKQWRKGMPRFALVIPTMCLKPALRWDHAFAVVGVKSQDVGIDAHHIFYMEMMMAQALASDLIQRSEIGDTLRDLASHSEQSSYFYRQKLVGIDLKIHDRGRAALFKSWCGQEIPLPL